MGYKAYSDGYLMSLTKAEIIELLRIAEHNFFAMEEALNNSAEAGMEIAEKFEKAKRLLKAAVEDLNNIGSCKTCVKFEDVCRGCRTDYKWVHAAEALALIEKDGDTNG